MNKSVMVALLLAVLAGLGYFLYQKGYLGSEVARVEKTWGAVKKEAGHLAGEAKAEAEKLKAKV